MPHLASGFRPIPMELKWEKQRVQGFGCDEIRARSVFYSRLVEWPFIDTYFEFKSVESYNPSANSPWLAPLADLAKGEDVPDVIIYISSNPGECARGAHLIPQNVGRVKFTEDRYEDYFERFHGPKFYVDGCHEDSEIVFQRVVGVLGFVRRLNMLQKNVNDNDFYHV